MKKRGLSQVVTTLIIIMLVLVAVGVVWVVISNLVNQGAEEIELEKFTINMDVKSFKINEQGSLEISVKRNPGKGEVSGIDLIIFDGAQTQIIRKNASFKELEEKTFYLNYSGSIEKISIAPFFISESGKETIGSPIKEQEFMFFRYDDNEMDVSRTGDTGDDGLNKWINISNKNSKDYSLWIYGTANSCNETADNDFRLKVNDNDLQVINFNWCYMFGLDEGESLVSSGYEWKKFKISSNWLVEGENKFNFYDVGGACGHRCANWRIGSDTDSDEGMSAWSSNNDPPCQPIRSPNPLRQDGTCYNEELMIFLTQ